MNYIAKMLDSRLPKAKGFLLPTTATPFVTVTARRRGGAEQEAYPRLAQEPYRIWLGERRWRERKATEDVKSAAIGAAA